MIELKDQEEKQEGDIRILERKNVQFKKNLKVGDIAHYHRKEDDEKIWEEACRVVEYVVKDEKGFRVNDERYAGKVVVAQCMADHLAYCDATRAQYEAGVFRGKTRSRSVASL
jgi:hypothetical protein